MSNRTKLSIRQRSNIRFFVYYLVNGTLNFDLLHQYSSVVYHDYLKAHPELFYQACVAFINLECKDAPNWPDVTRLGSLIAEWIKTGFSKAFEVTEQEDSCKADSIGFKKAFLSFSNQFATGQGSNPFIGGVGYSDFINDGATNVETCFAIWANVIEFENGEAVNQEHAISRVNEYLKMYYGNDYQAQLEEWEWELHFFTG
jgi:hypothetical protein